MQFLLSPVPVRVYAGINGTPSIPPKPVYEGIEVARPEGGPGPAVIVDIHWFHFDTNTWLFQVFLWQ